MCLEQSTPFNSGEEKDETLQKTLKVVNRPYKNSYVPGINIQGKYLNIYGFNTGDEVFVQIKENKISIEKIIKNSTAI